MEYKIQTYLHLGYLDSTRDVFSGQVRNGMNKTYPVWVHFERPLPIGCFNFLFCSVLFDTEQFIRGDFLLRGGHQASSLDRSLNVTSHIGHSDFEVT